MILDTLVIYAVLVIAIKLIGWHKRRQARQEWERLHPLLKWDDWKHVMR